MSVTVDISALDTAAGELRTEAAALRDADVAGPFAPIAEALPGTQTAEAAVWVSTRLGAAVQVFAGNVQAMAASASGTAKDYRDADAAAHGRMTALGAGPR